MIALIFAATLIVSPQTLAPDRGTYGQLVDCAGRFRLAAAVAEMDGEPELRQAAIASAIAYDNLAYLYGKPLEIPDAETDAAILAEMNDQITLHGRALDGPAPQLSRQVMAMDQQVCVTVSRRIATEMAETP